MCSSIGFTKSPRGVPWIQKEGSVFRRTLQTPLRVFISGYFDLVYASSSSNINLNWIFVGVKNPVDGLFLEITVIIFYPIYNSLLLISLWGIYRGPSWHEYITLLLQSQEYDQKLIFVSWHYCLSPNYFLGGVCRPCLKHGFVFWQIDQDDH